MLIKKIIANNFIVPGEQIFEFNDNTLTGGNYFNIEYLNEIIKLLNGNWRDDKLSFNQWYPKFVHKKDDMDLKIDALIMFDEDEHDKFNDIISEFNINKQKSNIWYYSIRCYYPYIFPIVTLTPICNTKKDKKIAIGLHYDKFYRNEYQKREMIIVKIISTIGNIRKAYFELDNKINSLSKKDNKNQLKENEKILNFMLSIIKFDTDFIKKLAKLTISFDVAEVVHFGYEKEFYFTSDEILEFINDIEILKNDEELKKIALDLLWIYYFKDLQYMFGTRASIDFYEILKILNDNFCWRSITNKKIIDFLNFNLYSNLKNKKNSKFTKKIEKNELYFIDKKINDNVVNYFESYSEFDILHEIDKQKKISIKNIRKKVNKNKNRIIIKKKFDKINNLKKSGWNK